MKTVYYIHKICGLLSASIFILLCVTGLILLFRTEIAEFNSVPKENPVWEISNAQVWQHTDEAIGKINDEFSNIHIKNIRAYPERNSLSIRFTANGESERVFYEIDKKQLITPHEGQKSAFVGEVMRTISRLHMNLTMGRVGRNILYVFCIISLITIVTGYYINSAFAKVSPAGYIRQGNYRLKISDWHRFISVIAAPWGLLLALSAVLILFYSDITHEYVNQAENNISFEQSIKTDKKLSAGEVAMKLEKDFPDKELLSVSMPDKKRKFYEAQLADKRDNTSLYSAYELAFVPVNDADNITFVPGGTFRKYLAEAMNVHIHSHPSMVLKILWGILAILSALMAITGVMVYCSRWRKKQGAIIQPVKVSAMPKYRLAVIIAILTSLGVVLPIISETLNHVSGGLLALVFIFAAYVYRRLN